MSMWIGRMSAYVLAMIIGEYVYLVADICPVRTNVNIQT